MKFNPNTAIARVECISVLRALPFRAYGDMRNNINCIALLPNADEGVLVMATDGYAAICLHDIGGRVDRPLLLPIDKGQKSFLNKGKSVLVSQDGVCYVCDDAGSPIWISAAPLIDGEFPDFRSIIGDPSEYEPGLIGIFNPNILEKVSQAYSHFPEKKGVSFFHHHSRPELTGFSVSTEGFGVVMGMKGFESPFIDSIPMYFRRTPLADHTTPKESSA